MCICMQAESPLSDGPLHIPGYSIYKVYGIKFMVG